MSKLKLLELFGGIGACSKALERLGIDYEIIDYVEIDKYAVKSFNAIYNTNFEPQDICKWDKDIEVDLIMHGSPCQDFSVSGKQAGGDEGSGTRSSLMYETIRIVDKLKPKYVIWENVKNVISKKHKHNYDKYCNKMSELGYTSYGQVLNAKDYGIPQNRERVFTISIRNDLNQTFEFPQKQELKLRLKDMLEDKVDEKYYLSEKMMNYVLDNNDTQKGTKWEGRADNDTLNSNIAHTLSVRGAAGSQRAGVSNFIVDNEDEEIKVKDLKLKIKNNTKKGYLEAHEGDEVYTVTSNKRGTVQPQMIQTITTRQDLGVVVKGID
jgi:DNA (cytosine-5)-methyltransferase 1